jgi:hypothetical protein
MTTLLVLVPVSASRYCRAAVGSKINRFTAEHVGQ